ncbi:MAG: response regulator [candidate division FCPU426 bacterium]
MHKILVVDDEPAIARLVQISLVSSGFEVRTVGNGQSALELLAQWQADVVVLDVMMPGLSGYEVCAAIRRQPDLEHIKVIFLTAKSTPADVARGLAVGGNDYLAKPFDPDDLLVRITHLLNHSGKL